MCTKVDVLTSCQFLLTDCIDFDLCFILGFCTLRSVCAANLKVVTLDDCRFGNADDDAKLFKQKILIFLTL